MSQSKHTKRALLASVLSMVVCCVMLLGSTFAWFTDSVTNNHNQIIIGNLDVDLLYSKTMQDGSWASVEGKTDLFSSTLWEPGHTEVVYFKIQNAGTLALDYELAITGVDTIIGKSVISDEEGSPKDIALSHFLKYGIVNNVEQPYADGEAGREAAISAILDTATSLDTAYQSTPAQLLPSETSDVLALVIFMPQDAGNEANSLDGTPAPQVSVGVTLRAKQSVSESDAFDNTYDENAPWNPVRTEEELRKAIQIGGNILLMNDITLSEELYLRNVPALVLDGNGFSITAADHFSMNLEGQYQLVKIETSSPVTLQNISLKHIALANTGGRTYHTLDVYGSPHVTLCNVTLDRNVASATGGAAMVLNQSCVTVNDNFTVVAGGSAWGGVNVDRSTLDILDATVAFTGENLPFAWTEHNGTISYPADKFIKIETSDSEYALVPAP